MMKPVSAGRHVVLKVMLKGVEASKALREYIK
jgi:hypothetical protein